MSDTFTFSDADRYNNILQMLVRCCVKVMKRLLPIFVSSLGYICVDQFLSREKAHILKIASASLQKNQDLIYPPSGTRTKIENWDMSLLSCVFTHVQRKLLCYEIADPIDPVLKHYKLEVLATTVGQQYEDKLYPRSGKPTEVNTWNMSLCSCLFSVLCPKPKPYVRLAESLNGLREMRNTLCHSERLEMEHLVYEEHMLVLKEFISSGLTNIGDTAFTTEIKEDMDDIEHGKLRSYILVDHKHLKESYDNDRDISQRLDGVEKGEMTLSMFFERLKIDQRNLLYSSFADVFTQLVEKNAPEIVGEIHPDMKDLLIHAICETWRIFDNPYEGRRIVGAKRECLKIQLNFENAIWMWKFIKYYISGTLDSAFEPIKTLLRAKKEFKNLEITVVLPDVFAALHQSVEAKEIDSSFTMCVLELLNQRLIPLEDKQQDDSVRKSLPLKLTNIQHDVENADIRTRKMEFDESVKTLPERKERLSVVDFPSPSAELYLDVSGQNISKAVSLQLREQFFEQYTIDEAGKRVKTGIQETPTEEYTVDESGEKVKAILDKDEKHIEAFTIGESGQHVKAVKHRESMEMYSTSASESKKKQVSYYCEPCLQDKSVVQHVVKCKDCDEMLCSECARVHRNSKMSRDHIMIEQQPDDLISMKFTPATTINVKSPSEADPVCLTDMVLLRGDRLIVVDPNNKKVKMVDLRTNNLMSQFSVTRKRWSICLLPGDRVAVCSTNGSIQFLKALGQLTLERSIEVGCGGQSIGYHNERLIVAYLSGKVVIMDMNGKVQKDSNDSGKSIFSILLSLTVVSESQEAVIFVSEIEKNTITKLDMDLNILQTFQDPALRGPAGMTAVGSQLLICGSDSNNIMCLHLPNSQMIQLLGEKDDIQNPIGICFSQQQNRLYVNSGSKSVRMYRPTKML